MKNNIIVRNFLGILLTAIVFAGFYTAFILGQNSVAKNYRGKTRGERTRPEKRQPNKKISETTNNFRTDIKNKSTNIFYGEAVVYEKSNIQGELGGKITTLKYQESDKVKKGEALVHFDTSKIDLEIKRIISQKKATRQKITEAESDYQTTLQDNKRNHNLFARGSISSKELEDSNNRLQITKSSLRNAMEELQQIEIDFALLKKNLQQCKLTSPINGIVSIKNYNLQEIYKSGDTIYEIINIDKVYVNVKVPENYISNIKPGMEANIVFFAITGEEYRGTVKLILPKSEQDNYNFIVRVLIDNPNHKILPGMFAKIRILPNRR